MAWVIYTGTITGEVGSLSAMLNTRLTAAGWTVPYTGTNKIAVRNSASARARKYFRIDDNAPGAAGAKEAYLGGFDTMSDVDTGTGQFPTLAQTGAYSGYQPVRKSNTASATARNYLLAADDKTAILFIQHGDAANTYATIYFGDFYSYTPGDSQCSLLAARTTENLANNNGEGLLNVTAPTAGTTALVAPIYGKFVGGSHAGIAGSLTAGCLTHPGAAFSQGGGIIGGQLPLPNPADGGIWLSPLEIFTDAGGFTIRGRCRGIYVPCHLPSALGDGDTFSGAGSLSSKSFRIVKSVAGYVTAGASSVTGCLALETSDTVETSS